LSATTTGRSRPGASVRVSKRISLVTPGVKLERTFTGADPKANWEALFEMIALFDRVARELQLFSATHSENLIHRVTDHAKRMREGVFAGGLLDAE
jgi:hypothetical protein